MTIADTKKQTEEKMQRTIEALKTNLAKIRTGRASPALLDHIQVDYYGSMVPINQVANITLLDARTIGVAVWEKKLAQAVDKAIRESDLGLNPSAMGEVIRVPMPPLSEERRKEMAKLVRSEGEHSKVSVRNMRRDANEGFKKLLKDKAISEDEDRKAQDEVQKMTDKHIAEIDKLLTAKEQEILTI
jgi:ribosome recycling factor